MAHTVKHTWQVRGECTDAQWHVRALCEPRFKPRSSTSSVFLKAASKLVVPAALVSVMTQVLSASRASWVARMRRTPPEPITLAATADDENLTIETKSTSESVSMSATAARRARSMRPAWFMLPETSRTMTMSLGPLAAPTYHERKRVS